MRGAGAHLTPLDAGGLFRLFSVHSVGNLTVEHLKLTGGNAGEEPGGAPSLPSLPSWPRTP